MNTQDEALEQNSVQAVNPTVTLVQPQVEPPAPLHWDDAAHMLLNGSGVWKLSGCAGSGVSSLLLDLAAQRIEQGWDPNSICILTGSKETAANLRRSLVRRLQGTAFSQYAAHGPLVRSVHSFAFALARDADPALRLLSGAEHDAIIQELLQGHAEEGGAYWPAEYHAALPMLGFARGLRDFLLRAGERRVTSEQLEATTVPLWQAAGKFLREYRQVVNLAGTHQLSASELSARALETVEAADESSLPTYRLVLVDDAQTLDPSSAALAEFFVRRAELGVMAGDVEQSVFHFRGASSDFFENFVAEHELTLSATHREPVTEVALCERSFTQNALIADTLRRAHLLEDVPWSDCAVIVRSKADIAPIRRALLKAGVPVHLDPTDIVLSEQPLVAHILLAVQSAWRELEPNELEAVVAGPVGGADPVTLRRLLRALRQVELAHGGQRRALIVLRELVGLDVFALEMKEYLEAIRDADYLDEQQRVFLLDVLERLTERELGVLHRVARVFSAGRNAVAHQESVEMVLWDVWAATKLAEHYAAVSLRGGSRGSQADRNLDAMMSLFDAAGDFAERRPTATIRSFLQFIAGQQLPTSARDRRTDKPQAVSLLTAHGALGQQFRRVVVAGVQEGTWPTMGETGTIFRQEQLQDYIDHGIDPDTYISRAPERLAEERRLLHLAMTRATEYLLVTAVDAPDSDAQLEPSRFIEELGITPRHISGQLLFAHSAAPEGASTNVDENAVVDETTGSIDETAAVTDTSQPALIHTLTTLGEESATSADAEELELERQLHLHHVLLSQQAMVAELRRVIQQGNTRQQQQAARQLARMSNAGIAAAHPDNWWGIREPSTQNQLLPADQPVSVSPSRAEKAVQCPLLAGLSAMYFAQETTHQQVIGTLVHAFAEAVSNGVDAELATALIMEAAQTQFTGPEWERTRQLHQVKETLAQTEMWLLHHAAMGSAEVELVVDVALSDDVKVFGRIDRLEHQDHGSVVIYDLKTGKQLPSAVQTQENLQLASYQLAVSKGKWGLFKDKRAIVTAAPQQADIDIDSAHLIYVAVPQKKGVAERHQARWDDYELQDFEEQLIHAARQLRGPSLLARTGPACQRCQFAPICPTQDTGRMITHG